MRTGISLTVTPAIRRHLKAVAANRNSPQKHVWRVQIVLLSAAGVGTNEIMRQTGKSKTCVWRWQERFMAEGFDGLLHAAFDRDELVASHGADRPMPDLLEHLEFFVEGGVDRVREIGDEQRVAVGGVN
jgi:hypothetical protein